MSDPMETQLAILIDGLKNKEQALKEIVNITENQHTVIESGLAPADVREFMLEMNKVKQEFIDRVKSCDNLFETILKEAGPELDAKQHLYKPQVAEMQKLIRSIMSLDVKVRLLEDENNNALLKLAPPSPAPGLKPKPKLLPPDNARVIKAYEHEKKFRG